MRVEEISDHLDIRQISQRYADAIDSMQLDRLDKVFLRGARLVYGLGENSFADTTYPEFVDATLLPALTRCSWTCHLISEPVIELRGQAARTVTRVIATHVQLREDGSRNEFTATGMYIDELTKTADGWRVQSRQAQFPCMQGEFLAEGVKCFDASSRSAAV